jgi:lysophospholipase L1-like esterase
MEKLLKFSKIFIINFILFLLFIFLLEGIVRWSHPEINSVGEDGNLIDYHKYGATYGYKAFAKGFSFGSEIITDKYGFRTSCNLPINGSHKSILILGDSVAMGVGVDGDKTFGSRLFKKYNNINIINGSVTGYTFFDYIHVLPKIINENYLGVILCLCLNDFDKISQKNIIAKRDVNIENDNWRRYPNIIVRSLRAINDDYFNFNDYLRCNSRTYLWIKSLLIDSSKEYFLADIERYRKRDRMLEVIRDQFEQLVSINKEMKKWLIVIILPYEYQLRSESKSFLLPQEMILRATYRLNLDIVNLYEPMRNIITKDKINSRQLYLFNDPCHFSEEGHRIVAEIISSEIARRKSLPQNSFRNNINN